jgi:hypothetical protein
MNNGKDFSGHETVAAILQKKVHFAHPYACWELGTNENTNGLVRQYLPKGRSFKNLNMAKCKEIERKLKMRPRKRLGFTAPMGIPRQIDCLMNTEKATFFTLLMLPSPRSTAPLWGRPPRSDGSGARPRPFRASTHNHNHNTKNKQQYNASCFLHLLVEPAACLSPIFTKQKSARALKT